MPGEEEKEEEEEEEEEKTETEESPRTEKRAGKWSCGKKWPERKKNGTNKTTATILEEEAGLTSESVGRCKVA
jgi:hypothetical protein